MIKNMSKDKVLAKEVELANSFLRKSIGLMLRSKSKFQNKSMLFNFYIENNKSFHTCFMRFPIDILFLNRKMNVTKIVRNVMPWTLNISGRAKYVVELEAGKSLNTEVGDKISFK
jgi:hypothetical protein